MEPLPTITVIVVNWNGLHHLRDCLPSLLGQDYPRELVEILIVDNGSVDGSVEFINREFPEVRLIRNSSNEGFAKPNNDAARAATGRYLALINNDMRAHPSWLSEAVRRIDESQGRVCVASKILSWDGNRVDFNGGTLQLLGYAVQLDIGRPVSESADEETDILFACGGAMLIRKDVYLAAGGFDPDYFAIFEDVDLGWRLWLMGFRVGLAPKSLVFHKLHGTLDRSREEKMRYLMHRNALWTIIKNYSDQTLSRVLPLAFVQAVHRAVFFSGVDRSSFYLWARQDSQMKPDGKPPEAILWQCRDALNHLVMIDDVVESMPALRAKRSQVQALRKVRDEDLVALFGDPFRSIVQDAHYEGREVDLLEHLQLDRLFRPSGGLEPAHQAYQEKGSRESARLRAEILGLEKQKRELEAQIQGLTEEPAKTSEPRPAPNVGRKKTPGELVSEFRAIQREKGLKAALEQTHKFWFG